MKIKPYTRFLAEESAGYAKLKSKNFKKIRYNEEEQAIMTDQDTAAIAGVSMYIKDNPELYAESYYKVFDEIKTKRTVAAIAGVSKYIKDNPELYDESYYKAFDEIKTKRTVIIGDKEDFEVFYSFSRARRGDRRYGNANWSARFLYEFLCSGFNGGERFIDTYLNQVFTTRPVYAQLTDMIESIQEGIKERWNDGNLKGGQWASFYKFQTERMDYLQRSLSRFSRDIRQDIILCLSTGIIPLRFSLAQSTINKRLSLGLQGDTPFFATSWLISQLDLHIILGDANSGMLYYSDTYKGER